MIQRVQNKEINIEKPETTAPVAEEVVETTEAMADTEGEAITEIDDERLGSKSDKVEFVCALCDPSTPDITPANKEKGTPKKVESTIVGYAFKVLEDMEVPDCGGGDDMKNNNMSFVNPKGTRMAKAGETIYLTRFETGAFLSQIEFNARATGGDLPVTAVYIKPKEGTKATAKRHSKSIATVALKPINPNSSIKSRKMIDVLTFEKKKLPNGNNTIERTIVPGFEKWEGLCKRATSVATGTRRPSSMANKRNQGAAAFLAMMNKLG